MSRSDGMRLTLWWTHRSLNRSRILSRTGRKLKVNSSQQTHEAISSSSCQSSDVWVAIAAHRVSTLHGELICQLTGMRGGVGREGEGEAVAHSHSTTSSVMIPAERDSARSGGGGGNGGEKNTSILFFHLAAEAFFLWGAIAVDFFSLAAKTQLIFSVPVYFHPCVIFRKNIPLYPFPKYTWTYLCCLYIWEYSRKKTTALREKRNSPKRVKG